MNQVVWNTSNNNVVKWGQSGDMPHSLYSSKMERTCLYEGEDQLNEYFRDTLKDRTPSKPLLAQDQPKETQNILRSEILNIRHNAARTAAEPIHPDLFLGFTERDSRGFHNSGPDMKKYADQSKFRKKYKTYNTDHASDWTIPEGTRSEMRVITDLRKTINPMKQRMKIFDTSRSSRSNPYQGSKSEHSSSVNNIISDGMLLNLNDAQEPGQRSGNTKLKSDTIRVGYRQIGDHRFSVAQYGILTNKQKKSNIHESQYNNETSHKFDTTPSEVQNRLAKSIIQEVNRRKNINRDKKEMYSDFNESTKNKTRIAKLATNLYEAQINSVQSSDVIDLGYLSNNIKKVRVYDPVSHDSVIVDKDIFDKVKERNNITFVKKTDPLARRKVKIFEGKVSIPSNEIQVYIYSRTAPKHIMPLPTKMDHKWKTSKSKPIYKQNHVNYSNANTTFTEEDHEVDPTSGKTFNSLKKGSGYTQGIRGDIIGQEEHNSINDAVPFIPNRKRK